MTPSENARRSLARARPSGEAELTGALRRAAAQWRTTFDAIASPIVILDLAGRIRRLNRAARDVTGRAFPEILDRSATDVGGGALFAAVAETAAKAGAGRAATAAQVTDPGTGIVWDLLAHFRGLGPETEEDQVIVVARDITELVALQESLRRSETLSALGAMVAGIAHQVRNPLFGISAALEAFSARYGDREELQRYADAIREPAARLAQLLQELLDYARPGAGSRDRLDLRQVAAAAVRSCGAAAERHGVFVVTPAEGGPVPLLGDRERLHLALNSVIENAILASPEGGRVEIEVERAPFGEEEAAVCRVRDHGAGFREEDIPRLGEPFFARRFGGTGLGLALVRRVVFEHGGTLRFDNAAGGGAEVQIAFPCDVGTGKEG